ncbi:hypothetical protein ACGFMK_25980 [Amycolatopsis sp. NPDC049252]|uniref:hypothetical protein n=1 Tax=Amycolatopsis sp. NPDC049252 TaxID=3363933 RepID=UPI0037109556
MGLQQQGGASAPPVSIRGGALVFEHFVETDPQVVAEASRWVGGKRGSASPESMTEGEDLSSFASVALGLAAQVMALGPEASGVSSLAGTVIRMTDRAQKASEALTADVTRASAEASEATARAAREVAKATAETLAAARKQVNEDMSGTVDAATAQLRAELSRLLGGDDTPVARAVRDLVADQMAESSARLQRTFTETLGAVSSTLDVGNPTSPLARLEHRLAERQDRQHAEVTARIDQVRETVGAATAAAQTAVAVAAVQAMSPGKGRTFEDAVGSAMEEIAAGLGGSYEATGDTVGALRACRKGDGILELPSLDGGGGVRVVIEMTTTGAPRKWNPYLTEAERNREADASIGVVPSTDLVPGRAAIAALAPNRVVVAHDPDGSHALLRAAAVLLSLRVQRDAVRDRDGVDLAAADARIAEAEQLLGTLSEVLKAAMGVKAGAAKVVTGIEGAHEALARALARARVALRGACDPAAQRGAAA